MTEPEAVRVPPDGRVVPRFAGPETFARLPRLDEVDRASVVIVGVPFDSGDSYRPGARFGPSAIRAGSKLLRPFNPELAIDTWSAQQLADAGDLVLNPFSIEEAVDTITIETGALLERTTHLVALGGDHTVALPLLRASAKRHGPLALVHFDAHLDTWDSYFGARYTHGTPFRRAHEEGLLAPSSCVHVGIRGSLYADSDLGDDAKMGFRVISALEVFRQGVDAVVRSILQRVADRPVYVSVDIDVLDPAHAPGTGTPEPGGLTSRELLALVRGLERAHVVGADVVEVSPAYDHAELTGTAAAAVVYELLGVLAAQRSTVP